MRLAKGAQHRNLLWGRVGGGEVEVGGGGSLVAQTLGRLNLETRDLVFLCVCVFFVTFDDGSTLGQ